MLSLVFNFAGHKLEFFTKLTSFNNNFIVSKYVQKNVFTKFCGRLGLDLCHPPNYEIVLTHVLVQLTA